MKVEKTKTGAVPQVTLEGTPLEDHVARWGLLVKRDDLACAAPGPASGRMRGVYAHAAQLVKKGARCLGVLERGSSQEVVAVAYAARLLQVPCVIYRSEASGPAPAAAVELGAEVISFPADPAYVYALHQSATADAASRAGVLMPPGLRLAETEDEVAAEVVRTFERATRPEFEFLRSSTWLISLGSASVVRGVVTGLDQVLGLGLVSQIVVHLPQERAFGGSDLAELVKLSRHVRLVDQLYAPGEPARPGPDPDWPADPATDLKALRWWAETGRSRLGHATFWNVG